LLKEVKMPHSPTNIQFLINRAGKWDKKSDFYEAFYTYATRIDALDENMLNNELSKMSILKAVIEHLAPKEDPLAD